MGSAVSPVFEVTPPQQSNKFEVVPPQKTGTARANELASKALTGAGLPTSLSDVPNWFRHLTGTAEDSEPFWEPIRRAIKNPTQENLVAAVPFIGPSSVAMSRDVQKGDYAGAGVDLASAAAPALLGKAPQLAEGLTDAGQAIHNAPSVVKNAIGTALRDELNNMKPGIKATTALGKLVGIPEVADALIPDRPGAASLAERRPIPITKSPNFDPAAYKAGAAERTTQPPEEPIKPGPFEGATSSRTSIGNLRLPEPGETATATSGALPKGTATPFVGKFTAPEASKIVSPLSPPPPVNRTLVSYDRDLLVHMARGGDLNALRELIRNPGGINIAEAVPNSKYLLEGGAATNIYGGPK